MEIGIIQSFFGKWCYRKNANTVLNSITPSAHYLALKRFNIPVCLPHISSWKRNLLRLFEWHEILQSRGGTACASPRGVPLLSEADGFVPLELTEKRETHQENVANVPFLSMLRFTTRCTGPVCTGCNNQVMTDRADSEGLLLTYAGLSCLSCTDQHWHHKSYRQSFMELQVTLDQHWSASNVLSYIM